MVAITRDERIVSAGRHTLCVDGIEDYALACLHAVNAGNAMPTAAFSCAVANR